MVFCRGYDRLPEEQNWCKNDVDKNEKGKLQTIRKDLLFPTKRGEPFKSIENQVYSATYYPPWGYDCHFAALRRLLQRISKNRLPHILMSEILYYLSKINKDEDWQSLELFVTMSWEWLILRNCKI